MLAPRSTSRRRPCHDRLAARLRQHPRASGMRARSDRQKVRAIRAASWHLGELAEALRREPRLHVDKVIDGKQWRHVE